MKICHCRRKSSTDLLPDTPGCVLWQLYYFETTTAIDIRYWETSLACNLSYAFMRFVSRKECILCAEAASPVQKQCMPHVAAVAVFCVICRPHNLHDHSGFSLGYVTSISSDCIRGSAGVELANQYPDLYSYHFQDAGGFQFPGTRIL